VDAPVALEGILGLERRGASFRVDPCIPSSWPGFTIDWRVGPTSYAISVENPEHRCRGVASAELDGEPVDPREIPLAASGGRHVVKVVMGAVPSPSSAALLASTRS
jgi:Cellobiose phosphorylase